MIRLGPFSWIHLPSRAQAAYDVLADGESGGTVHIPGLVKLRYTKLTATIEELATELAILKYKDDNSSRMAAQWLNNLQDLVSRMSGIESRAFDKGKQMGREIGQDLASEIHPAERRGSTRGPIEKGMQLGLTRDQAYQVHEYLVSARSEGFADDPVGYAQMVADGAPELQRVRNIDKIIEEMAKSAGIRSASMSRRKVAKADEAEVKELMKKLKSRGEQGVRIRDVDPEVAKHVQTKGWAEADRGVLYILPKGKKEASEQALREDLIKLAFDNPDLRSHLLPILSGKEAADSFEEAIKGKKFRHPETGNDVAFKSLPSDEQKKVREDWNKKKDDKGGKFDLSNLPDRDTFAKNPDKAKKVLDSIIEEDEDNTEWSKEKAKKVKQLLKLTQYNLKHKAFPKDKQDYFEGAASDLEFLYGDWEENNKTASLREDLIRVAFNNPELRADILPLLEDKEAGSGKTAGAFDRIIQKVLADPVAVKLMHDRGSYNSNLAKDILIAVGEQSRDRALKEMAYWDDEDWFALRDEFEPVLKRHMQNLPPIEDKEKAAKEQKLAREWGRHAKEKISVSIVKGTAYGFGSELACLRLFHTYNKMSRDKSTDVNYSQNYNSWFFRMENM